MIFAGHRPNRREIKQSRTAAVRAPIEECNETFMEEVNNQIDTAKPSTTPSVHRLKDEETINHIQQMDAETFALKTNTFPVTMNDPNLRVIEYDIQVHSKGNEQEKSSIKSDLANTQSSPGMTLKQEDIAKYLNKLSRTYIFS